jgi:ABC-type nickel/cobalt efflux system permease component RcnA
MVLKRTCIVKLLLLTAGFQFANGFQQVSIRPHKLESSFRLSGLRGPAEVEEVVKETTDVDADGDTELPFFLAESEIHHHDHHAEDDAESPSSMSSRITTATQAVSRREWLRISTVLVGGVIIGGSTVKHSSIDAKKQLQLRLEEQQLLLEQQQPKNLVPVNFTQAATKTFINVTLDYRDSFVSLDHATFSKKRTVKLPAWVPPFLVPKPVVVRDMTNTELLMAATVAGSAVEIARTSLLYPLLTIKTRIQADTNYFHERRNATNTRRGMKRRMQILQINVRKHVREGQLYAGIVPSLLVSVPAMGVYYGVRDVVKRGMILNPYMVNEIGIAVAAALVADVVSLMIRTPADALAFRLQVATGESHSHEHHHDHDHHHNATNTSTGNHTTTDDDMDACMDTDVDTDNVQAIIAGNWFIESIERLPAIILTDLPFLLSKIALGRLVLYEGLGIGQYEVASILTAVLCAFLTTPFDVARTRLLVDSDNDPTNGIDGGSGGGLLQTFQTISKEGNGGLRNLFAGWLERTIYLGVGRAWIEPLQLLGYIWIRDAILLEWYD